MSKRAPTRLQRGERELYVNRNTPFPAQVARAEKLLAGDRPSPITIHGLGAAMNRAINLALRLEQKSLGTLTVCMHSGRAGDRPSSRNHCVPLTGPWSRPLTSLCRLARLPNAFQLSVATDTVDLVDDISSAAGDRVQLRKNSAVRIQVSRK